MTRDDQITIRFAQEELWLAIQKAANFEIRSDEIYRLVDAILAALPSLGYAKRNAVLEECAAMADKVFARNVDFARELTISGKSERHVEAVSAAGAVAGLASAIRKLKSPAPSQGGL